MTNTTPNTAFGLPNTYLPTNLSAVFGMRGIVKGGSLDLMSDRMDRKGDPSAIRTLTDGLKANHKALLDAVATAYDNGTLDMRSDDLITLVKTDDITIVGSPRTSGEYLHLSAFLTKEA